MHNWPSPQRFPKAKQCWQKSWKRSQEVPTGHPRSRSGATEVMIWPIAKLRPRQRIATPKKSQICLAYFQKWRHSWVNWRDPDITCLQKTRNGYLMNYTRRHELQHSRLWGNIGKALRGLQQPPPRRRGWVFRTPTAEATQRRQHIHCSKKCRGSHYIAQVTPIRCIHTLAHYAEYWSGCSITAIL